MTNEEKLAEYCGMSIEEWHELKKEFVDSGEVVSAPGAVLKVTTFKIPDKIQAKISAALQRKKKGNWLTWLTRLLRG